MRLDNSFPVGQFLIDRNSLPFRLDRNNHGECIMIFVNENIPCKFLSVENQDMQGFPVEVNLKSKRQSLALFSSHYENLIIMTDFSVEANDVIQFLAKLMTRKGLLKS